MFFILWLSSCFIIQFARGNYGQIPLILSGSLCPVVGRIEAEMMNGEVIGKQWRSSSWRWQKKTNTYLGGSGAYLATQVRLISEPARTNSSGPDRISAFDTEKINQLKHSIKTIPLTNTPLNFGARGAMTRYNRCRIDRRGYRALCSIKDIRRNPVKYR